MIKRNPPKLFLRFFRWFCHPKLRDPIEGDLMELYRERKAYSGKWKADVKFIIDVFLLFRLGIIRPVEGYRNLNNYGMIKSYFKIGWRSLRKEKSFSFVNILGLAIGMTAFLFIVHYVRFERSYEDYNPQADNIYRVTIDWYKGAEYVVTDCETHAPLGPMLKEKMPEVKDFVRLYSNDGLQDIKVGAKRFLETGVFFADPSVFSMLSLHVLHGDATTALVNPMKAVITESLAIKLFGRVNVVGETFEKDLSLYEVTAVVADSPSNTHLKVKMLLSHITIPTKYSWYKEDSWDNNNEYTYVLVEPGTDLTTFNKKLAALSVTLKDKISDSKYTAEPMKDIHLYSNKTFEPEANGNAKMVFYLELIAGFIIFIAWINYINLSTARAIERAREVGIRKVMGSLKSQLILQFLSESLIVNLLAGIFAFALFTVLLQPFRNLVGQSLPAQFISDKTFWYLLGGLLATGSLLSGIYPAFVLSSFQPVAVLKGKFRSSSHGQLLRKGLVVFQFGTTVVLLIGLLTVYFQLNHLRHVDLGMNIDQTLIVRAPNLSISDSSYFSRFQSLKNELQKQQGFKTIAQSNSLPGLSLNELSSTFVVKVGENQAKSYTYYYFGIDADFIPAMDMKLIAGRNFENGLPNMDQIIINEEAVERLGFASAQEAIGSKVTFQTRWPGEPSTIIGVLKNFYQRSPKEKHIPMIFQYARRTDYFSIRLNTENIHESIASVQATYEKIFPNTVFSYFFLDDKFNQQYQADAQFGKVIATFSGLAVFIACLGLFGLSSYTIVQRTKEIGIRKVLGASVPQIVTLLSGDFLKVIAIAALLALPVAYFTMKEWLLSYEVRISLNVWIFVIPVIVILMLGLITVSFQTIRTALSNPSGSLKSE